MKIPVKVKATGVIIDVTIGVATAGNPLYITSDGVTYLGDDIEPAEPNWQQVRIDAAIKLARALSEKMLGDGYSERQIAKQAVDLADALVAELQKKGGQDA